MSSEISVGENVHADEIDVESGDRNDLESTNNWPQVTDENYNQLSKTILREICRREKGDAIKLLKATEDVIGQLRPELEESDEASVEAQFEVLLGLANNVSRVLNRLNSAWQLLRTAAADVEQ